MNRSRTALLALSIGLFGCSSDTVSGDKVFTDPQRAYLDFNSAQRSDPSQAPRFVCVSSTQAQRDYLLETVLDAPGFTDIGSSDPRELSVRGYRIVDVGTSDAGVMPSWIIQMRRSSGRWCLQSLETVSEE